MSTNSLPEQPSGRRPDSRKRYDTLAPLQEREPVTRVPVAPSVSLGTYCDVSANEFGDARQLEPCCQSYSPPRPGSSGQGHDQTPPSPGLKLLGAGFRHGESQRQPLHENAPFTRTVLSATFTVPQTLRYSDRKKWEVEHQHHRAAHLNALDYLSSQQRSWDHTIIAWTGEVGRISEDVSTSSDWLPGIARTLNSTSKGGLGQRGKEIIADELFIPHGDVRMLEEQLFNGDKRIAPVWLADDCEITNDGIKLKRQSRWRRYAEHDLCALFHYRQHPPAERHKVDARWDDYVRMNWAFADKIYAIYKPGDIIMVHDYYLMLLPALLRQRCRGVYVLFVMDSPFPTSELFRCLRRREEILKGVLGSNLISFQAFSYAQHFGSCCNRILGSPARSEWVGNPGERVYLTVFSGGIDMSKINSLAYTDSVCQKYAQLTKIHEGKKVIIGCDPLDRLGGVDKKLEAFKRLLDQYPRWRQNVVLLQITSPPTNEDDGGDNFKYATKVNELANAVNQVHGSLSFTPVELHAEQLSQDEYFAVLRLGDAALNTCVREGMSTTSLEYIACQQNSNGVLIISEFSGTASSMEEAMKVNPWDVTEVAAQINNALTMTAIRRRRMHEGLYRRMMDGNVVFWVNGMLERLVRVLSLENSGYSIGYDDLVTNSRP